MNEKVDLTAKLAAFDEYFSPKIVGELNDYKLELVKVKGEFVWHAHPDTDDFFLVLVGRLTIQLRDRDIELGPGELFVVPRGVEHCPKDGMTGGLLSSGTDDPCSVHVELEEVPCDDRNGTRPASRADHLRCA